MSDTPENLFGKIAWTDLTVPNAEDVSSFYQKVVGWQPQPVDMGSYNDFAMVRPETGDTVAGICHARGGNADLPPCWMVYINVSNLDESLSLVQANGGTLVAGPKDMGSSRYAIIKDPAGAVFALYQP